MNEGMGGQTPDEFLEFSEGNKEGVSDSDLSSFESGKGFRIAPHNFDSVFPAFHFDGAKGFQGIFRIDDFGESRNRGLQLAGWNTDVHWFSLDVPKAVEIASHGLLAGLCV